MKKEHEVMVKASEESLALLRESYPIEQGFQRILLPRLGFYSQDQVEGKGKSMKVVTEAGTFYLDLETDEVNEEGKKIWEKQELGTEIEGTVIYGRRQLRVYDEATEKYTSSPIYDTDSDIIPLFCDKVEVARGTPAELKAKYQYKDEKTGKMRSKLEDNRVLYVLYKGEIYQMTLRGSSLWSFSSWSKKVLPPSVLTKFSSEPQQKGQISWNKMTFEVIRGLSEDEVRDVLIKVGEIKEAIRQEKAFYANQEPQGEVVEAHPFGEFK